MYSRRADTRTTIQEFIALEHTKKNLLISAAKRPKAVARDLLFQKASDFQALFGITHSASAIS